MPPCLTRVLGDLWLAGFCGAVAPPLCAFDFANAMYRPSLPALTLALTLAMASIAPAEVGSSLQDRVDRLAEQIHLRYRHHEPSLEKRRDAVAAVLVEWNRVMSSGDSETNRQQITAWLDAAMVTVMPGGSGRIPEAPRFADPTIARTILAPSDPVSGVVQPIEAFEVAPTPASRIVDQRVPTSRLAEKEVVPSKIASGGLQSRFSAPRAAQQRSAAKPVTPSIETPRSQAPRRSKWSRSPSAAPLEWRDPFVDDPAASPNPLRSGVRRKTQRPVTQSARAVKIDFRQLAADIRGYNGAIRDLQASVLNLPDSDVFGLVEAAEELNRLEERRQFHELYRSGLSVSQQAVLPGSPSVELVRELVVRKATAMTQQAPPRQRAEQRALEQLKERLARTGGANAGAF